MKKDEEELSQRFIEEFDRLGKPKNKVASELGFVPQTLTNITKGYNLPSIMLLSKIKSAYPEFDTEYVINGKRTVTSRPAEYVSKIKTLEEDLMATQSAFVKLAMKNVELLGSKADAASVGKDKGATFSPNVPTMKTPMMIPTVNRHTNKVSLVRWVASTNGVCAKA